MAILFKIADEFSVDISEEWTEEAAKIILKQSFSVTWTLLMIHWKPKLKTL